MLHDRKRVVWSEGMMLDPHHFQQWDRYFHGTLNARVRALARFEWGLSHLEIDKDRLANGEFSIVRCSGVLPDGLVFDMPESDETPEPRNVQNHFGPTEDRLSVYLSSPIERTDGGNVLLQDGEHRRETRYRAESLFVPDENTGTDPRQIDVARSVFQLRMGREALQEYTSIKVAEVVRSPAGTYILNDRFVPPCLSLAASERLQALTRRLLELLVTKSAGLMERHRAASVQREVSPADVTALGLLSVVNAYIPLLNHHLNQSESHPEPLYLTLLMLAGQLTAYVPEADVHPRRFPAYDHAALSDCFNRLDELLHSMLGGARVQTNYIQIPLQKVSDNRYTASVDAELLQNAQFFLVARSADLTEEKLVTDLPVMLRVASPETMDRVLASYTRALPLEHTHRLPSALPVDGQANYFQLQKRGPFWEAICASQAMAIFTSGVFSNVDLQLVAVRTP